MDVIKRLVVAITDMDLWYPAGMNDDWDKVIAANPDVIFPYAVDLAHALGIAVGMIIVRFMFLEPLIFRPLGQHMTGFTRYLAPIRSLPVFSSQVQPAPGDLEAVFSTAKNEEDVARAAKRLGVSADELQDWLEAKFRRQRAEKFNARVRDKMQVKLGKFGESSWRAWYYTAVVILGIYTLWDKSWLADTENCWIGYPYEHHLDNYTKYYYLVSIAYYISALLALVFIEDPKKDYWEMFLHHCVAIWLISHSYIGNFWRIGTLILLVHDMSDPFLEYAKLSKYTKVHPIFATLCDIFFTIFAAVFGFCRLYLYPVYILYPVWTSCHKHLVVPIQGPDGHPLWWVVALIMLGTLQVLHMYWFFLIVKMIVVFVRDGNVGEDARSESEPEQWVEALKQE